jgi:hypothetical protein
MKKELEEKLYNEYPKLFKQRHLPITHSCMPFGCEHGDGWFSILNNACSVINWHIEQIRKSTALSKRYNRALKQAINGNTKNLTYYYKTKLRYPDEKVQEYVAKDIEKKQFREQWQQVPTPLVFSQVKEKFGTLRIYSYGGDQFCEGVIAMAERMSAVTCEHCGLPGKINNNGWITTLCSSCRKEENPEE